MWQIFQPTRQFATASQSPQTEQPGGKWQSSSHTQTIPSIPIALPGTGASYGQRSWFIRIRVRVGSAYSNQIYVPHHLWFLRAHDAVRCFLRILQCYKYGRLLSSHWTTATFSTNISRSRLSLDSACSYMHSMFRFLPGYRRSTRGWHTCGPHSDSLSLFFLLLFSLL